MAPASQARMTPITGPHVSRDPLGTPASLCSIHSKGRLRLRGGDVSRSPEPVPTDSSSHRRPSLLRRSWLLLCISWAGELREPGGDAATHPALGPAGVGLSVTLRARCPHMASQQQGEWNPKWGPLSLLINFPHPSTLRVIHLLFGWDSAVGRRQTTRSNINLV